MTEWSEDIRDYVQENIESIESGNLREFFGGASDMEDALYSELVALTKLLGIESSQCRGQLLVDTVLYRLTIVPLMPLSDEDLCFYMWSNCCHFGFKREDFDRLVLFAAKLRVTKTRINQLPTVNDLWR